MKRRLMSALALAALVVGGAALPAQATEGAGYFASGIEAGRSFQVTRVAPVEPLILDRVSVFANPSADVVAGAGFFFSRPSTGTAPVPGTQVHVSVTSCGAFIQQSTKTFDGTMSGMSVGFSPDGGPDLSPNPVNQKVSKTFEYSIDITEPGFDSYHYDGSQSTGSLNRPSCEKILNGTTTTGNTDCQVTQWSKKVSVAGVGKRAVAGHKVKVTKTTAPGCTVKYVWKANGKQVGTGVSLRVTKNLKGKTLINVITASSGKTKKIKTLTYGRVR